MGFRISERGGVLIGFFLADIASEPCRGNKFSAASTEENSTSVVISPCNSLLININLGGQISLDRHEIALLADGRALCFQRQAVILLLAEGRLSSRTPDAPSPSPSGYNLQLLRRMRDGREKERYACVIALQGYAVMSKGSSFVKNFRSISIVYSFLFSHWGLTASAMRSTAPPTKLMTLWSMTAPSADTVTTASPNWFF